MFIPSTKEGWADAVAHAYEYTCPVCGVDPQRDCKRKRRKGESFIRHHQARLQLGAAPQAELAAARREARARVKAEAEAVAKAAQRAVARASEATRLIHLACEIHGITQTTLATVLGVKVDTVRSWAHRGSVEQPASLFLLRLLAGEDPDATRYLDLHPEAVSWQAWGYALRQRMLQAARQEDKRIAKRTSTAGRERDVIGRLLPAGEG